MSLLCPVKTLLPNVAFPHPATDNQPVRYTGQIPVAMLWAAKVTVSTLRVDGKLLKSNWSEPPDLAGFIMYASDWHLTYAWFIENITKFGINA